MHQFRVLPVQNFKYPIFLLWEKRFLFILIYFDWPQKWNSDHIIYTIESQQYLSIFVHNKLLAQAGGPESKRQKSTQGVSISRIQSFEFSLFLFYFFYHSIDYCLTIHPIMFCFHYIFIMIMKHFTLGWPENFSELYFIHFQVDWMLLLRYSFVIFHIDLNLGLDTPNKVTNQSPVATTGPMWASVWLLLGSDWLLC